MGMIINPYRFGGAASLLLDTYTGAAAAYSLRKLRTAYTGYCIEVRRSSDNATQNIGFVNGVLDESALTTFCGAGDGFVKTWYDQSTNGNNATMTTTGTQPQIVSSGSVFSVNGKVSIKFANKRLDHGLNIAGASTLHSLFCIVSPIANSNYSMPFAQGNNGDTVNGISLLMDCGSADKWGTYESVPRAADTALNNGTQYHLAMIRNGSGNGTFYLNGGTDGTYTSTSGSICKSIGHASYSNEYIQEVLFYNSDQSLKRSAIESNINSFYSIY